MAKHFGLDLGTNSIGWTIIDTDQNKLIECGTRIFPTSLSFERRNRRRQRQQTQRNLVRTKLLQLTKSSSKSFSIISVLTIVSCLTFLLALLNFVNWQFWLNISLTALFTTLTLLHENNKK